MKPLVAIVLGLNQARIVNRGPCRKYFQGNTAFLKSRNEAGIQCDTSLLCFSAISNTPRTRFQSYFPSFTNRIQSPPLLSRALAVAKLLLNLATTEASYRTTTSQRDPGSSR